MGSASYINPIIQAMNQYAQSLQSNNDLAERTRQNKADEAYRQQALSQATARFEQEHELNLKQLDISTAMQQQQLEANKLANLKAASDMIANGVSPSVFQHSEQTMPDIPGSAVPGGTPISSATPQGTLDIPGYGNAPQSAFETPQARLARMAQNAHDMAQASSSGSAAGAEPFDIASDNRKRLANAAQKQIDFQNELHRDQLQGGRAENLAKLAHDSAASVANIEGAAHLKATAMMYGLGLDDGSGQNVSEAKQLVDNIYNGTGSYKDLPVNEKRLVDGYLAGTGESLPTNQKDYSTNLNNLGSLQQILRTARTLAINYSRDSNGAFANGNQVANIPGIGVVQRTKPGSDLASQESSLAGMSGTLAKSFESTNRANDATLVRSFNAAFDPKATMSQNLQKIQTLESQLGQTVRNTFPGMKQDRINQVLTNRGITIGATPKSYKIPAVNANGHQIGSDDGQNWYDVSTGQHIYGPGTPGGGNQ